MYFADMHCDTIKKIWFSHLRGEPMPLRDTGGYKGETQIDLAKLAKGGGRVQNFAIFVDLCCPADFDGQDEDGGFLHRSEQAAGEEDPKYLDPWTQFTEMAAIYHREIAANPDVIREARSYAEIRQNLADGKMSAVLTVEEGGILQGDIDRLQRVYEEGVRMMTLTWNYENELGFPNRLPLKEMKKDHRAYYRFRPEAGNGLKAKGFEAAEEMERLGILVDVSHLSDAGFYDVARTVKGPFVASHSNARAIAGCNRNLTDEMIRAVGEHGGVIGLNFCPAFVEEVSDPSQERTTLAMLARHARHMMNVGGRGVVGIGTDFDGIAPGDLEIRDASEMQKLVEGLERMRFTPDEIERICYRNVLDVYREVLR